ARRCRSCTAPSSRAASCCSSQPPCWSGDGAPGRARAGRAEPAESSGALLDSLPRVAQIGGVVATIPLFVQDRLTVIIEGEGQVATDLLDPRRQGVRHRDEGVQPGTVVEIVPGDELRDLA